PCHKGIRSIEQGQDTTLLVLLSRAQECKPAKRCRGAGLHRVRDSSSLERRGAKDEMSDGKSGNHCRNHQKQYPDQHARKVWRGDASNWVVGKIRPAPSKRRSGHIIWGNEAAFSFQNGYSAGGGAIELQADTGALASLGLVEEHRARRFKCLSY